MAQSGHTALHCTCPLSGVKRTSPSALHMSAFDPKRTSRSRRLMSVVDRAPTLSNFGAQKTCFRNSEKLFGLTPSS